MNGAPPAAPAGCRPLLRSTERGLLRAGEDPAGCLRWGSAMGASCVRSITATDGVFDRSEAEAFMHEHSLEIETL